MKIKKDVFNYELFKNLEITGSYNSPVVKAVDLKPLKVIPFNYALTCKSPKDYFVHFYIDDYQFERIWNKPKVYLNVLKKFKGVIGADFSTYRNLSMSQRIYNIYRNKALMAYWQKSGLNVIPNARWIDNEKVYNFNNGLDGLPTNSTLAITTHSCLGKKGYPIFKKELADIIEVLKPIRIVCIGKMPKEERLLCNKMNIELLVFDSFIETLEKRRKYVKTIL